MESRQPRRSLPGSQVGPGPDAPQRRSLTGESLVEVGIDLLEQLVALVARQAADSQPEPAAEVLDFGDTAQVRAHPPGPLAGGNTRFTTLVNRIQSSLNLARAVVPSVVTS